METAVGPDQQREILQVRGICGARHVKDALRVFE
jgi:hypothetical protein